MAPWPQKRSKQTKKQVVQKTSLSALLGDLTAVILVINREIFNQMILSKVFRAQEGISRSQSNYRRPQKRPKLANKRQKSPQMFTFYPRLLNRPTSTPFLINDPSK